jgi:TonB family protein
MLFESAFRSLAVATAVWACLVVLRIRNPFVLRASWLVVLAASLSMPLLMQVQPISIPTTAIPVAWNSFELESVTVVANDWKTSLASVYFLVSGALLVRLAIGLIQTWRLRRNAQPVAAPWCAGFDVRATAAIRAPVTFASTILLPSDWASWNAPKLHAVVAHESAHVRHRDFHVQILTQVHRALFWFSPLAWWLPKQLGQLNELISDDAAIACITDRATYAHVLFEVARDAHRVPAALSMAQPATVMARVDRALSETKLAVPLRWSARLGITLTLTPLILLAASGATPSDLAVGSQLTQAQLNPTTNVAPNTRTTKQVSAKTLPQVSVGHPLTLPEYPEHSRVDREEGTTYLQVLVGEDGAVLDVRIYRTSGYPQLDAAAASHARTGWRFVPGTENRVPAQMWVTVPIVFKLDDSNPQKP